MVREPLRREGQAASDLPSITRSTARRELCRLALAKLDRGTRIVLGSGTSDWKLAAWLLGLAGYADIRVEIWGVTRCPRRTWVAD